MSKSRPHTSIPVTRETFEAAKAQKRGGESWDSLVQELVDQYRPEEAHSVQ